jgi:carbamate kinase
VYRNNTYIACTQWNSFPQGDPTLKTAVIAVGGNAILRPGDALTQENQMKHVTSTCKALADLIQRGYDIVVTHGNGPQVGNILLRAEIAKNEVPANALDVCVAESQGQIGYMIQQALSSEFSERGMDKVAVSMITQVVVSEDDPAFKNPSKPIGKYYSEEEAKQLEREKGWNLVLDKRRGGWRRVVPSPEPIGIVESTPVRRLVFGGENQAEVVIACGGGGIPVIKRNGRLVGIEAVVDKDLAAAILANNIRERLFIIATDVEHVCVDFGKPTQRPLTNVTLSEIRRLYDDGQFPPGSMGPKVLAAMRFLEGGGEEVVITATERLVDALESGAGTHIYRDDISP